MSCGSAHLVVTASDQFYLYTIAPVHDSGMALPGAFDKLDQCAGTRFGLKGTGEFFAEPEDIVSAVDIAPLS